MILFILCLLLIAALIAHYFKRFKTGIALLVLSFLILLLAGYGIPAKQLLSDLQATYVIDEPYQWSARNAIVLLGAGTEKIVDADHVEPGIFSHGRIAKTAQVYAQCKSTGQQCIVYVSGGDPQRHGTSEAVIYSAELQKSGVLKNDLVLEKTSRNTWQNALFITDLLKHDHFGSSDTVLLVSSGIHMQRSLLYFSYFGIAAKPARADYAATLSSWLPLSYNLMLTDAALHEYIGIWRFHLYNFLGLNNSARLPSVRQ